MSDYVTDSGKEITFDLNKMSISEFRNMLDPQEDLDKSDATLARVAGIEVEELQALPYPDYKRLGVAFFKKVRSPLSDPNP